MSYEVNYDSPKSDFIGGYVSHIVTKNRAKNTSAFVDTVPFSTSRLRFVSRTLKGTSDSETI